MGPELKALWYFKPVGSDQQCSIGVTNDLIGNAEAQVNPDLQNPSLHVNVVRGAPPTAQLKTKQECPELVKWEPPLPHPPALDPVGVM